MLAQFVGVGLQDAFVQVAGAEVEGNVQHVDQVAEIVKTEPHDQGIGGDLLEGKAVDEHPKVVEERQRDDHGPIVAEAAGRIEDERPFASAASASLVRRCVACPVLPSIQFPLVLDITPTSFACLARTQVAQLLLCRFVDATGREGFARESFALECRRRVAHPHRVADAVADDLQQRVFGEGAVPQSQRRQSSGGGGSSRAAASAGLKSRSG